jgi:hypothetical protein
MFAPNTELFRYILSIDIGIKHLGLVLLEVEQDYTIHDLVWFELVDLTRFEHDAKHCALPHTKTFADWLAHFFHVYHKLFELCEHVLIERQPPGGHVAVEQLIFYQFRSKAKLIHPRSMHHFFGWSFDPTSDAEQRYNIRKSKSLRVLEYRLKQTPRSWLSTELERLSRQHDIADAYCQSVYFTYCQQQEYRRRQHVLTECDALDQYRFSTTSLLFDDDTNTVFPI